jgi:hypothetical protein
VADNTVLNAGSGGDTIASDDIGGVKYQRVKVDWGPDGTVNDTDDTTNKRLPVKVGDPLPAGSNVIGHVIIDTGSTTAVTGTVVVDSELTLGDLDTGAGTDNRAVVGLVRAESGGGVLVGSANPLPISGTVSLTADQAINVHQINGTTADTNSGTKSAGTLRVVLATDQPALTNKLLVTPDSVALPLHQSTNVDQLNGTTVDTNSGTKSAGTLRVVLATDQPALTNKLLVTPDALPANQSVNVAQVAGTATSVNSGNKDAGTIRTVVATDQPNLTTDLNVKDVPQTSGGLSFVYVLSGASNNKTQVKGSAGQLYCVVVTNINASPRYLKVFNNVSASVTMGTTAADYQFLIPGNAAGAGVAINIDKGIAMGTGITIAITTGVGLTDNTSTAANEQSVLVGYK